MLRHYEEETLLNLPQLNETDKFRREAEKKKLFMNEIRRQSDQQQSVFSQLSGVSGSTLINISCRIVDPI